jgi:hypothetical protein
VSELKILLQLPWRSRMDGNAKGGLPSSVDPAVSRHLIVFHRNFASEHLVATAARRCVRVQSATTLVTHLPA